MDSNAPSTDKATDEAIDNATGAAGKPNESRTTRRWRWVKILIGVVLGLFLLAPVVLFGVNKWLKSAPPTKPLDGKQIALDQGVADDWSKVGLKWFAHENQGTMIMPYKWFVALEQPELTLPLARVKHFCDKDYLASFGFLASEPHETMNPEGLLPVGFSIERNFQDPRDVYTSQDVVGLTCAACHTGKLTVQQSDKSLASIRIQGGSGTVDLREFQYALGLAVQVTLYDPLRMQRFHHNVLGSDATAEQKRLLHQQLDHWLKDAKKSNAENEKLHVFDIVQSGPGRTDALALIGNRVFGLRDDADADKESLNPNLQIASAPVNFPPIWDTSWFDWVQYNSSIRMVMVRNIGEALGVGARTNMNPKDEKFLQSSVNVKNLHLIEDFLGGNEPFTGLRHPKWQDAVKAEILPKLDDELVAKGRELYKKHCVKCHLPSTEELQQEYSNPESVYWTKAELAAPYDKRFLRLRRVPLAVVGTDPLQAVNFANRTARFPDQDNWTDDKKSFLSLTASGGLRLITESLRSRAYEQLTPEEIMQWDRFRKHLNTLPDSQVVEAPLAYRPRPHNGIWATPPYLHNGSVPTLRQLLSPVDERDKKFWVGSTLYDTKDVGLADRQNQKYAEFDTARAGNRNIGHEFRNLTLIELEIAYGRTGSTKELDRDERWAAMLGFSKSEYMALSAEERTAAKRVLTEAVLRVRDKHDVDPYAAQVREYVQADEPQLESVMQDYKSMGETARSDIRKQAVVATGEPEKKKADAVVAGNVGSSSFTGVIGPLLLDAERDALLEYLKSL